MKPGIEVECVTEGFKIEGPSLPIDRMADVFEIERPGWTINRDSRCFWRGRGK